jgi:hypothetical protein
MVSRIEIFRGVILIVGIQHGGDGLGALLVGDRALILPRVELLEVEFATGSLAAPQTKIVRRARGIARNWSC